MQRVLDRGVVLSKLLAGGRTGFHGQQLVGVTEFFVRAGIGVLYIRHDEFIVVDELGERLADHWVGPVGPGHLDLHEGSGGEKILARYTLKGDVIYF